MLKEIIASVCSLLIDSNMDIKWIPVNLFSHSSFGLAMVSAIVIVAYIVLRGIRRISLCIGIEPIIKFPSYDETDFV